MHLIVLGSPESWYMSDLLRAAEGRHRITPVSFRLLASRVHGLGTTVSAGQGWDLAECDAVLVRSMPAGSLEQIVFRMDALGRLEASGVPVINPPRALEIAVDKYLASVRLQAAGLLVPETVVCQSVEEAMVVFDALGGDVVVKPLFGSEGRGITRVTDEAVAVRVFHTLVQLQAVLYLQRFIPHHGYDLRLLVIGPRVLAMRRCNQEDWRTNVARGAIAEPIVPTEEQLALARAAAEAVGALVAGVDLLPGQDGRLYAIEVNAVPGWKALASALHVDVARLVLKFAAERARRTR